MSKCINEKKRKSNGSVVKNCKCDECCRMRKRNNASSRARYASNPEKKSGLKLKSSYGLTLDEYGEILSAQNGVCAICHESCSTGYRLAVDHDHSCCPGKKSCGKCIRGLLCANCNHVLGLVKDSPELLRIAADYLDLHKRRNK